MYQRRQYNRCRRMMKDRRRKMRDYKIKINESNNGYNTIFSFQDLWDILDKAENDYQKECIDNLYDIDYNQSLDKIQDDISWYLMYLETSNDFGLEVNDDYIDIQSKDELKQYVEDLITALENFTYTVYIDGADGEFDWKIARFRSDLNVIDYIKNTIINYYASMMIESNKSYLEDAFNKIENMIKNGEIETEEDLDDEIEDSMSPFNGDISSDKVYNYFDDKKDIALILYIGDYYFKITEDAIYNEFADNIEREYNLEEDVSTLYDKYVKELKELLKQQQK